MLIEYKSSFYNFIFSRASGHSYACTSAEKNNYELTIVIYYVVQRCPSNLEEFSPINYVMIYKIIYKYYLKVSLISKVFFL